MSSLVVVRVKSTMDSHSAVGEIQKSFGTISFLLVLKRVIFLSFLIVITFWTVIKTLNNKSNRKGDKKGQTS